MAEGYQQIAEDQNNFYVVTGTTANNVNEAKVIGNFPTGWDVSNTIIIGYTNRLPGTGQWQSNSKEVQVFSVSGSSSATISATVAHSAFTGGDMKVLLKKV